MSYFNPYQNQTPQPAGSGSNATFFDGVPISGTATNLYDTYMYNNSAMEFQIYTAGNMAFQNSDNVNIGGGIIQGDQVLTNPTFGNTATYVYVPATMGTYTGNNNEATTLEQCTLSWPAFLMVHAGTALRLSATTTVSTDAVSESVLIQPYIITNSAEYDLNSTPFTLTIGDGPMTIYTNVTFFNLKVSALDIRLYIDCEIRGMLASNTTGIPDFYSRGTQNISTDFNPVASGVISAISCTSSGSSALFLGVGGNYQWQW